jgi:diaminohydroxyphosphoribosylaminopyrimidine deaminase/5-amino-6-(5-phosphoribosylamino)uracil reductase
VHYGSIDPNPQVAGRGVARLRGAGIEVSHGPLAEACRRLIAPFAKHQRSGQPYLILKAAMTLDGQLATSAGESRWISSVASREHGHRLRDRVDGILTGAGTVLVDDPQLTVRLADGRNPARIVVDGQLRTPLSAKVYAGVPGGCFLVTAVDIPPERLRPYRDQGIEIVQVSRVAGGLDLAEAMGRLGGYNLMCLLVEGGGALNRALLRAGLVDRLVLFVAPLLFGGNDGTPLFAGAGVTRLADALHLNDLQVSRIGEDLLLEGEVSPCSPD